MAVSYQDGIAILQLIIYIPCLCVAVLLTFRHGLRRSSSWYFIAFFTLIRIVGTCCLLATISRPRSIGLHTTAIICSAIGLSPLILTCVGLLSRANHYSERVSTDTSPSPSAHAFHSLIFHLLTILTLIALILCIVGGVESSDSAKTLGTISPRTKAGVIIFVIAWVLLCCLLAMMVIRVKWIVNGERRLVLAVAISIPFILVRLIYSAILSFAHNPRFSLIGGSVTINLVMAVLEEFVVIIVCLGVGLTLRVHNENKISMRGEGVMQNGEKPARGGGNGMTERQHPSGTWQGGPITRLVRQIIQRSRTSI